MTCNLTNPAPIRTRGALRPSR